MSLILEALNRSRQESEPVPGVGTQHAVAAARPQPYRLWLALGVALLVIVWLVVERYKAAPASAPETTVTALSTNVSTALTSVQTQLQARAEEEAAKIAANAAANRASSVTGASAGKNTNTSTGGPADAVVNSTQAVAPAAVPGPAPSARDMTPSVAVPLQAVAAATSERSDNGQREDVAALYRRQAAAATAKAATPTQPAARASATEESVDLERVLLQARDEMENARLVEHAAPFLATLSQSTKDSIPTILYQRHDYDSAGGRSSVVLNSKTLHEGGVPVAGMKVQEILPDSVVLEYRGTVFRLRALNSWVNL